MPLKAYFQDISRLMHGQDAEGHTKAIPVLRLGVLVWHLGWAGFMLLGLLWMLLLPGSLFAIAALIAVTVPGAASTLLLSRDAQSMRQALLWLWSGCAVIAVGLTGGISGPLAAWCALPLVAATALNQRTLISLGAAQAVGVTLLVLMLGMWSGTHHPLKPREDFWLSLIANVSLVGGLAAALMPSLRLRVERANDAEDAREKLLRVVTEQPCLLLCLNDGGAVVAAYGETPPGLDLKAMVQGGVASAAHLPDRTAVKAAIEQAATEGRAEVGFTPHTAMDHYVGLSLRRGSDNRLYGVMSDATLAHAREAQLEAARSEADQLNQGKTRFLASMSHELRTPLNAVIGFSDIMRLRLFGELPPKYAEYAQLIWESGQHVLDMINDVLDMSKIEAQRYELALEDFDMREPVSAAVRLLRGQAHEKGIDINARLPQAALNVTADKRAIKQICLNLLSNAVKFTPRGGDITLDLTRDEERVDIVITDTGIGIAPDDLNRIGQPYEQSGPADQRAMGTGLGLSIVKAMAHLLGGTMVLKSILGQGTTVIVSLPLAQPDTQPELELPMPEPVVGAVQSLEAFARAAVHPLHNPLEDIRYTPDEMSHFGDFVIRPPKS